MSALRRFHRFFAVVAAVASSAVGCDDERPMRGSPDAGDAGVHEGDAGHVTGTDAGDLVRRALGEPCDTDSECVTGAVCAYHVCCTSRCTDSCEACDLPGSEGTCTPIPRGYVCRAAAGDCDAVEVCDGASAACPEDAARPAGTMCRPAMGTCDVAETCDGSSTDCPDDAVSPAGTVCREGTLGCDVDETCTGASRDCPDDALVAAGTTCREAAGPCDAAETCTGADPGCPPDAYVANGTSCGATSCGSWGTCGGFSDACDSTGTRSRSCTDRACSSGACVNASRTETGTCTATRPAVPPAISFTEAGIGVPSDVCNALAVASTSTTDATGLDNDGSAYDTIDGQNVTGCVTVDFGSAVFRRVDIEARPVSTACTRACGAGYCGTRRWFRVFRGTTRGSYSYVETVTLTSNAWLYYSVALAAPTRYVVICRTAAGPNADDVLVRNAYARCS